MRKVTDERIVSAIAIYIGKHGYSPCVRDVSTAIGISVGATKRRLNLLRDRGAITFEDGMARTIRIARS